MYILTKSLDKVRIYLGKAAISTDIVTIYVGKASIYTYIMAIYLRKAEILIRKMSFPWEIATIRVAINAEEP